MQSPHTIHDQNTCVQAEKLDVAHPENRMLPLDELATLVQRVIQLETEANRWAAEIDVSALVGGDKQAEKTLLKLMRLFWDEAVPLNQRATDLARLCAIEAQKIRQPSSMVRSVGGVASVTQPTVSQADSVGSGAVVGAGVLLFKRVQLAAATMEANIDQRLVNIWELVLGIEARVGEELVRKGKVAGLN